MVVTTYGCMSAQRYDATQVVILESYEIVNFNEVQMLRTVV
jgi:hypothetical protein